jgi:hypothetical protein
LGLARAQARSLGVPELRLITIPHPLAELNDSQAQALGLSIAPRVAEIIVDL